MPASKIKALKGASYHTLNLLCWAKLSLDSSVCNIDKYLNSLAIT